MHELLGNLLFAELTAGGLEIGVAETVGRFLFFDVVRNPIFQALVMDVLD